MHRVVTVRRCVMVPTGLSISHWTPGCSTSRFPTVVWGAGLGGFLFYFHTLQLRIRLELCKRGCFVTLGRDIRDFPHDPLKFGRLFCLFLIV